MYKENKQNDTKNKLDSFVFELEFDGVIYWINQDDKQFLKDFLKLLEENN